MRYIKPAVLSSSMASKSVMGLAKMIDNPDSQAGNPVLSAGTAYESDE